MKVLKNKTKDLAAIFQKYFDLIGYMLLLLLFVYIHIQIWNNLEASIESDMSTELVLSKMLANENRIMTTNWFYATELKVLHNTLLFSFLFHLTDNWHIVRIVSIVILNIVLFFSYFYLARKLKIKHIPWIAFMIIGSTSREYYKFVTLGSHYIPDLAISFVTLGLLISIAEDEKKVRRTFKILGLLLLSFVASLSGTRFLAVLHLPLFVASVLFYAIREFDDLKSGKINLNSKYVSLIILCFVMLITSYLGVYMNSNVFPALGYTYKLDGTDIHYIDFGFDAVSRIINGWLTVAGYQYENLSVFSIDQIIIKPLFALFFVISLWSAVDLVVNNRKYNDKETFTEIFYLIGILLLSGLYIFTSMWYRNRYLLSISVFSVFIIGIFVSHYRIRWQKNLFILVIVLFTSINSAFQIQYHVKNDSYIELATVRDILLENSCYNGYCRDHWNGNNILTELSDGKIETWYGTPTIGNGYQQAKYHLEENPKDKVFALLLKNELEEVRFKTDYSKYLYYEDDDRVLFIFNSYDEMNDVMDW